MYLLLLLLLVRLVGVQKKRVRRRDSGQTDVWTILHCTLFSFILLFSILTGLNHHQKTTHHVWLFNCRVSGLLKLQGKRYCSLERTPGIGIGIGI